MQWTRSDLKAKAKSIFSLNYWKCVGATVIFTILTAIGTSSGSSSSDTASVDLSNFSTFELMVLLAVVLTIIAISLLISVLIDIFVRNPLKVGYASFLNELGRGENVGVGYMFNSLKGHYVSYGVKMFTTGLITTLWGFLFIIPGIIKAYEYMMVPYILADNPELSAKEARALSSEMMAGNKWDAFVLELSFFGWYLLSAFTCGILAIFYVNPYKNLTEMELYLTLKKDDTPEEAVSEVIE